MNNRIVYRELSSLEKDLEKKAVALYSVSNNIDRHYTKVSVPKRNGGVRVLSVPDDFLKAIQQKINKVLLYDMPVSPYARAYRSGISLTDNAKPHIDKDWVLKLDIQKFFDSVMYSTVKERVFPESIYSEPLRVLLTLLCYHGDSLPQGAPTSPAISNIILYDFDMRVGKWCRGRRISYTRYCDDMTFSGFGQMQDIVGFIRNELAKEHLFLNESKTVIAKRGMKQEVTGLVVNEKVNTPSDYRRKIRQEIYYIEKFGVDEHINRAGISLDSYTYLRNLLGRVNYVLSVTPDNKEMKDYFESIKQMLKQQKSN